MANILIGIPYLEGKDINPDGSLKTYVSKGKPVIVMVQGNYCPHCTVAKPALRELAKQSSCVVATVQIDGDDNDKQASKNLAPVNKSRGVPAFLGFDKNGRFVKSHEGNRDLASLQQFISGL